MSYKRLFLWVEGPDDERLLRHLGLPLLRAKYDFVEIQRYARLKKEKIVSFLKSIRSMSADYIWFGDINLAPCATAKKESMKNKYEGIEDHRIVVVIKEIEGWYLAGLDRASSATLGIGRHPAMTDAVTKENFNQVIPRKFDSRIDFMMEILKYYDLDVARRRNTSLSYFLEKHDC